MLIRGFIASLVASTLFLATFPDAQAAGKVTETISGSNYLDHIVATVSDRYGVDPLLIHAIIRQESAYDIYAVSHKGAQGLMQLMPATQRDLGVKNSFDPWQNVDGGVRYMLKQLFIFQSLDRALGAYYAGPRNESEGPRLEATSNYIAEINRRYHQLLMIHHGQR